jgi:hypothetical protein
MSFSVTTYANAVFKRLLGKSHTVSSRDPGNESIPSTFTLSAQSIWASKLNPVPGNGANTGLISDLVTLTLEPVSGTANSGKYAAYRCKIGASVPTSLVGKINRQTGLVYAIGDYVGDIIPQQFGDGFRPKLFKGATETPPLDASNWFLDCSAGVLAQEEVVPAAMLDYSTTGTVQCYIYIGAFVSDALISDAITFYDYQTLGSGVTGVIDGSNAVFTLDHVPAANSVHLFLNGLLTKDFTVNGSQITIGGSTIAAMTSSWELYVNYRV